jgi:hypothetical protein
VIQTLSADGAYHSLSVGILPGGPWCNRDFFDADILDTILEIVSVDSIAVADKKSRSLVEREGIYDLLSRPLGAGICRNVEMNDLPPVMTEHDEDAQDTKGHGRNREKVAGGDVRNMIVQKRPPGLRRRFPSADHVLGHGCFGDIVAQQKQFGQDSGSAPRWVFAGHAPNQVTNLAFDARASRFAGPGFPPPIQFESLAMPSDDRFRMDKDQS